MGYALTHTDGFPRDYARLCKTSFDALGEGATAMPMLYRHTDGTYTVSGYGPESPSRRITAKEGEEILRERVPEPILSEILADDREGFCLS